jgi:hypothetical protein
MKILSLFLVLMALAGCSSKNQNWDTGAKRQEASEQELRTQQQDVLRNQFPGARF